MSSMEMKEYIASHIKEAIDKGWIEVYYQPVMRTISGAMCGMEALARWRDPIFGFLSPASFIPVLEESHGISDLDKHIIEVICRDIQERMAFNLPVVPVSFNVSWQDFLAFDVLEHLEIQVREHGIPRSFVHIEITEGMILKDSDRMAYEISRFYQAGYQVWMDDFGSGYSSLNVLKDFTFDTIKLDMAFLSNMSERARQIIVSVVDMAKKIGINTLAEGVETEEQLEFLKSIGCEKAQGYYFGKPMALEDSYQQIAKKHLQVEDRAWRKYYNAIGKINVITELPIFLVEDNGNYMRMLYGNETFLNIMGKMRLRSMQELEDKVNSPLFQQYKYLRNVADSLENVGQETDKYYTINYRYFHLHLKVIAICRNTFLYEGHLYDVTHEKEEDKTNQFTDQLLRSSLGLYHWVTKVNIKDDSLTYVYNDSVRDSQYTTIRGIRAYYEEKRNDEIYPADWDRFMEFYDFDTVMIRLYESSSRLVNYFRRRTRQGTFRWEEHVLIALHGEHEGSFLALIKDTEFERDDIQRLLVDVNAKRNPYGIVSDGVMWRNFQLQTTIKFFWKDRQRRFLGVSTSFLQYYGITRKDVIGKTDEDMNWHVDDEPYRNDELDVIEKGISTKNVPGSCVIHGVLHNIIATKMPLYSGGRIIGLMGYFEDADDRSATEEKKMELMQVDAVTGVMSTYATITTAIKYVENSMYRRVPFARIRINIMGFHTFYNIYGRDEGLVLLKKIAETLYHTMPIGYVIGRVEGATFIALGRYKDREEVEKVFAAMQKAVWDIHESNGYQCTLTATGRVRYSEDYENPRDVFQDW